MTVPDPCAAPASIRTTARLPMATISAVVGVAVGVGIADGVGGVTKIGDFGLAVARLRRMDVL